MQHSKQKFSEYTHFTLDSILVAGHCGQCAGLPIERSEVQLPTKVDIRVCSNIGNETDNL